MACPLFNQSFKIKALTLKGSYRLGSTIPTSVNTYDDVYALRPDPLEGPLTVIDPITNSEIECSFQRRTYLGNFSYKQARLSAYSGAGIIEIRWGCSCDIPKALYDSVVANRNQSYSPEVIENLSLLFTGTEYSRKDPVQRVTHYTSMTRFPISKKVIRRYYDVSGNLTSETKKHLIISNSPAPAATPNATGTIDYEYINSTYQYFRFTIQISDVEFETNSNGEETFGTLLT